MDVVPETSKFVKKLQKLDQHPLPGGWEENTNAELENADDMTFFGTELRKKERRNRNRKLFVSKIRVFSAIRAEILMALQQFMTNRLHIDENTSEKFGDFVKLTASESEVREVHASIAPDLDLRDIANQYQDLRDSDIARGIQTPSSLMRKICEKYVHEKCFKDVIKVLARILASKPHSADCERLISAYNMIKTQARMQTGFTGFKNPVR